MAEAEHKTGLPLGMLFEARARVAIMAGDCRRIRELEHALRGRVRPRAQPRGARALHAPARRSAQAASWHRPNRRRWTR